MTPQPTIDEHGVERCRTLDEIETYCAEATEGPWEQIGIGVDFGEDVTREEEIKNSAFACNARTDLPLILERLRLAGEFRVWVSTMLDKSYFIKLILEEQVASGNGDRATALWNLFLKCREGEGK